MGNKSTCLFDRGARAAVTGAALVLAACSAPVDSGAPPAPIGPSSPAAPDLPASAAPPPASAAPPAPATGAWAPPDPVFGDWHEDQKASTEGRSVFVPSSINLGMSRFRRTLHLGRDRSFSTLRLDAADAHYECAGTFVVATPNVLSAQCTGAKQKEALKITVEILEAGKDRLVVKMTP